MSSRFEIAPAWVLELLEEVRKDFFRGRLTRVRIAVLWDTRKREKGGQLVVGRIKKAGDVEKLLAEGHLVPADDIDGLTYVMFLDKAIFEALERLDRVRIIRHELRHIWIEITEAGKVQYKIWEHDIQDFKVEVELNGADPDWRKRVSQVANSVYDEKGKPIPGPDPNQKELFGDELEKHVQANPEKFEDTRIEIEGKDGKPSRLIEPKPEDPSAPDRSSAWTHRLEQAVIGAVNEGHLTPLGRPDPEHIRGAFGWPSAHPEPTDEEIMAMYDQVKQDLVEEPGKEAA